MCGLSGILYKRARSEGSFHVGNDLVMMLEPMTHRGKDSSGVTIMGEQIDGDLVIRIWTENVQDIPSVAARSEETVRHAGGVRSDAFHEHSGPISPSGGQLRG